MDSKQDLIEFKFITRCGEHLFASHKCMWVLLWQIYCHKCVFLENPTFAMNLDQIMLVKHIQCHSNVLLCRKVQVQNWSDLGHTKGTFQTVRISICFGTTTTQKRIAVDFKQLMSEQQELHSILPYCKPLEYFRNLKKSPVHFIGSLLFEQTLEIERDL